MGMSEALPHHDLAAPPSRKALVVGIDHYQNSSYRPLLGCEQEAIDFGELLERHQDGSDNFGTSNVAYLLGPDASKNALQVKIRDLLTDPNDLSLLYFSGHGADKDVDGALVAYDGRAYEEGIEMSHLIRLASLSPAKLILFVLDCCYSGRAADESYVSAIGKQIAHLPEKVVILSASEHYQPSAMRLGKSLFTHSLINGLAGSAHNGTREITIPLLYEFVAKEFQTHVQKPSMKSYMNHSVLLRRV
jgi:hypothetical protein